jgi:hypothetical protein
MLIQKANQTPSVTVYREVITPNTGKVWHLEYTKPVKTTIIHLEHEILEVAE